MREVASAWRTSRPLALPRACHDVEIIDTLRHSGSDARTLGQVYLAYGDLVQAISCLVTTRYPAAQAALGAELANQTDDRYDDQGKPTFGHTPCCFYARWNTNAGKSEMMARLRELAQNLKPV